jgi:DNA-binding PadR family transcriptional regulator
MSQVVKEENLRTMIIDHLNKKEYTNPIEIYDSLGLLGDFAKSPTYKRIYKTFKDMAKEGKLLERYNPPKVKKKEPVFGRTLDFTLNLKRGGK